MANTTSMSEQELLYLVLEVDQKLSTLLPLGSSGPEFYELLYGAARQIAPTDAFYTCLYDAEGETLFFPCNWEGEKFETCEIKPLGSGPTSWVIRNRKTYVLEDDQGAIQHSRNRFGDVSRPSLSAVHAPMLANDLHGDPQIHGVLSMQCYERKAYNPTAIQLFEWLARRAGMALQRDRERAEQERSDTSRRLQEQANEFNRILKEINRLAEVVWSASESGRGLDLRETVAALCRACYQGQSRAVLSARQPASMSTLRLANEEVDPFLLLTPQERRVLALLCRRRTYRQMGLELSVEASTVKSHVTSILRKLNVSRSEEAADLAEPFLRLHESSRR